jgi:hypothetical protein
MAQKEGINTSLVVVTAAVSCLVLVVIVFSVQGWFQYETQMELDRKWAEMGDTSAADRKADQLKNISAYRWVDQKKGIAAIPIDDAMKQVAQNNGKVPWETK